MFTPTGSSAFSGPETADVRPDWPEFIADLAPGKADQRAYLLLLRFALLNLVSIALLGAAYLQGWISALLAGDTTYMVTLIFITFLAGLFICTRKILQVSWELNQLRSMTPHPASRTALYLRQTEGRDSSSRSLIASALRLKLGSKITPVRYLASTLVLLGLIGTVVGFIMALSGVDPQAASDASAIGGMVATLIGGMSVALYTTLVGAVLNIWLMIACRLLESGTAKLLTGIVERGELHA
ncbi:MotA/TolQ/ExbB proton channel family protein [Marinivivus vitaminiproducens]|uniref:MotA/TolQ/ExbB proton channel family protein n=1 Tax=Marinivivus vitaminiproducens TaxID=3035935 RepID=UPI0027A94F16|nr:MotA/TolQ/ExbB proton channel family protein [Geminicoccaceae bacterium SCSIO 64248]